MKAVLSLFVSYSQKEAKGKRTLAMDDISRAHFYEVPVSRVFVEIPAEEKERLARKNGNDLEYVGLLRKCMNGWQCVTRRCSLASAIRVDHESNGLSNLSLFVHVERDFRLLNHVDDFMVVYLGWRGFDGSFVLEPCGLLVSRVWQD